MSDAAGTSRRTEGGAVMVIKLYHVQFLFICKKLFCASDTPQSLNPKGHKPDELWFPLQLWLLDLGSAQESSSATFSLFLPLAWRELVTSVCDSCVQRANLGRIGAGRAWNILGSVLGIGECVFLWSETVCCGKWM